MQSVVRKEQDRVEAKGKTPVDAGAGAGAVTVRARSKDEEGKKMIEKAEIIKTRNPDTIRYVEKKLRDKGVQRMDRHPADGIPLGRGPPKSGHGGKFTWEGPADTAESELDPVPPAIDPRDPNYEEEEEEEVVVGGPVIGEVEVAKVAEVREGVSRIEVQPPLKPAVLPTELSD